MEQDSKEIDIKFLLGIVNKWKVLLFTIVVSSCLLALLYSYLFITPTYEASAKLYITTSEEAEDIDLGTIELNIQLMNTYKEMIKTNVILEQVRAKLIEYPLTIKEMKENIEIIVVNETPLMNIKVQDHSIERAEQLVNQLLKVVQTEIPNISKLNHVIVLERPQAESLDVEPISPNYYFIVVIMFILSFFTTFGILTTKEVMADTMKYEEDIRDEFNIVLLSDIPKVRNKDVADKYFYRDLGDGE